MNLMGYSINSTLRLIQR